MPVPIGMPGPLQGCWLLEGGGLLAQCPMRISSGVQGEGGRRWEPAGAGQDPAEREGVLGQGVWGSGGRLWSGGYRLPWCGARAHCADAAAAPSLDPCSQGLAPSDQAFSQPPAARPPGRPGDPQLLEQRGS